MIHKNVMMTPTTPNCNSPNNGIVTDFEMAKIFADAEAIYSYEGTHEINTLVTGRAITGISAIV